MSDFQIDTHEVTKLAQEFSRAQPIIREEMLAGMNRVVLVVERSAKANVPVLTGTLRRSISHNVTAAAGNVTATVSAKTPYARAIEEGRPEVTILPKKGKYLVFEIDGEVIFARKVVQPARAAQPYLKPAITKNRAAIEREFAHAVPQRIIRRLGVG
jgi:hypothetical protein